MKVQTTKKIAKVLLVVGCINATIPYFLAAGGRECPEELGIAWITEVVAVALGYFVRGYKDTKEEKYHEYRMERERRYNTYENEDIGCRDITD